MSTDNNGSATPVISQFISKTTVYHGIGSTELTGAEAAKNDITKAMIVTDRGVRNAGLLENVGKSLAESNIRYDIFDEVEEDADVNVTHKIASLIKESGLNGIVVVGGGSPICAAKGAALEVTNGVADVRALEGWNVAKIPPLPVICLPTTAGSGSDVSPGFPVLDYENQRHFGIGGELVPPRVSILDPLLLKTCPRWPMTFATIDALTHAMEALWSNRSTPLTDALAFEAIKIMMNNLKEATLGDDMEAKLNQQLGCTLAMIAGENAGLGIVHVLGGICFNLKGPHGYKCGVFLPHAMEFNMPGCESKLARMETLLDETGHGKTTADLAGSFLRRIKKLFIDLDFPRKFKDADFSRDWIPGFIKEARSFTPPFLEFNIREVTDADIERICELSLTDWAL
ncbi:MAG: iron-containing alcohol dehydrogenase [Deltaproteobacteria bacterium]|nr:iron-containing alcohol dehydrogenase [Deltaproteobacteria bacterium]